MLNEITGLRQSNRSLNKRWFTCRDMDLFVWFRKSVPIRFQLSFNKRTREQAITWDSQRGFHFYLVDTGETCPDSYKKTPIFINTYSRSDLAAVAREFLAACENIEVGLADFIYARLIEYPGLYSNPDEVSINHPNLR